MAGDKNPDRTEQDLFDKLASDPADYEILKFIREDMARVLGPYTPKFKNTKELNDFLKHTTRKDVDE